MILREFIAFYSYHRKHTRQCAIHDYDNVFKKIMRDLSNFGINDFHGQRILDLGCGQRYPSTMLFSLVGADVYGLDINYISQEPYIVQFFKSTTHDGLKRAVKTLARHILFDKSYYDQLNKLAGRPLSDAKLKLIMANPRKAKYPVEDNFFDIVICNAVLQYVPDVRQFAVEINRMLRPGGIFHILYHNFYSLSGGHNPYWAYPDSSPPSNIPPWDHLRENKFPSFANLNKVKPDEVRDTFSKYSALMLFEGRDINHDRGKYEGEKFYTEEIANELSMYPKELLLTRSYSLIGRKPE